MTKEEMEEIILDTRARVARLENVAINDTKRAAPEVASDRELDSMYGDPEVRKDPPLWVKAGGQLYAGSKMSETTPLYLDALASFFDWKATKDLEKKTEEGDKYARYSKRDASRARGWAKRLREGWKAPSMPSTDDDGSLPF